MVLAYGEAERVMESGTPLPQPGAPCMATAAGTGALVAAGAGTGATGAGVVVVFATAFAASLLFGHSYALCPVSPQTKQVNVPSAST